MHWPAFAFGVLPARVTNRPMASDTRVGTVHTGIAVLHVSRRVVDVGPSATPEVTAVLEFEGPSAVQLTPTQGLLLSTMLGAALAPTK